MEIGTEFLATQSLENQKADAVFLSASATGAAAENATQSRFAFKDSSLSSPWHLKIQNVKQESCFCFTVQFVYATTNSYFKKSWQLLIAIGQSARTAELVVQ
jgi:hypothetical protein